jgi:uncharacterized membrane protein
MADLESIAALEGITASLRRQRQDLQTAVDATANGETTKVLEKLEELRRRAEETQRLQQDGPNR